MDISVHFIGNMSSQNWNYESFRQGLKQDFKSELKKAQSKIETGRSIRIDLHCHDKNSDVPDDLWGRLLGLPETWLKTKDLIKVLKRHHVDAITVTNHNNAKSCWQLIEKGVDVLSAAEFTCYMSDNDVHLHVLAYGFSPSQEIVLNKLRKDLYSFMAYTKMEDIPTVLPHPTYLYFNNAKPQLEVLEKLAVIFERFEVLNGQRDVWQNMLTLKWLMGLTKEDINALAQKHNLNPHDYCRDPYNKRFTGGSDDHMGIFAGSCGTILEVPEDVHSDAKPSFKVLEALRRGRMAPYGSLGEEHEKLNIAFLDYFSQVAINMKDPGLMRLFLHRGSVKDKLLCLSIANAIFELRQHKHTLYFLKILHKALAGKKISTLKKWLVSKSYRPFFEKVIEVSKSVKHGPEAHCRSLNEFIEMCYQNFAQLMFLRFYQQIGSRIKLDDDNKLQNLEDLFGRLELPLNIRSLLTGQEVDASRPMSEINFSEVMDELSFPFLVSTVLGISTYASATIMFNSRSILDDLAESIGSYENPRRILWLADSIEDKNGASVHTRELLEVIRKRDLPIDLLVCGEKEVCESHLHVVPALGHLKHDIFGKQVLRMPDIIKIVNIAYRGAYSRIVASSELMALPALAIKTAYRIPSSLFLHHDWVEYFQVSHKFEKTSLDRVRRLLRTLYQQFDQIFVLNEGQRQWLGSEAMNISAEKIHLSKYWLPEHFFRQVQKSFNFDQPTILYVGRLSHEKGVMKIPELIKELHELGMKFKMKIVGEGPCKKELQKKCSEAEFLDYRERHELIPLYQDADLLVFPSKFDAFGACMLEAMSQGLPVATFKSKASFELLQNSTQGILVDSIKDMSLRIFQLFHEKETVVSLSQNAYRRSEAFNEESVLCDLFNDLEMPLKESLIQETLAV